MAKVKVPKRVGGVKVPRKLRKQAKKAINLIDSRAARELALAGLAIAAENVIDRGRARSGNGKRLQDVIKDGLDGLELGEVLRAAAIEGARRFLEGFEEGQRSARAPAKPARPARPARTAKPASAAKPPRTAKPASAAKSASPAKSAKSAGAAKKPTRRKPNARRSGAAAG
jgi:hypothetical protein